ncbi:transcription termination factor NusG domain protein [Dissulfurispira thermophila]|uniref:Transcription termination factor NusG domain protein n=2 Tax=root TaxID=1 RepID=A0A7G1H2C1_9BACT|nr:UpxY family transcription antiterminator [Dissulfurispira thermophila]BCB96349.1 transcription termination factor NusG domain protein [Dissulfurispira thermophila]
MELTETSELYWYAIHVRSRHEFKVLDRLTNAGIDTFLPVVERLSKWKDRKKLISFPLFPGYLFVHIHKIYDTMLTILKTPGVVRFIGIIPGDPEPVPEEQIISLKKLVESKESIDPYPYLKEGQRVRIKRGPLKGVEGILVKRPGQHILVLSVDILRQGVSIKIDASDVEKA